MYQMTVQKRDDKSICGSDEPTDNDQLNLQLSILRQKLSIEFSAYCLAVNSLTVLAHSPCSHSYFFPQ